MPAVLNSGEVELHDSTIPSGEIAGDTSGNTHRLLLFTLFLSAISSILAIVVAIRSQRETDDVNKKKEITDQNIKRELQE